MVRHTMLRTRQIRLSLRHLYRQLSRSRGVVLRALLCWAIGCVILFNDEVTSYDSRLQIRGNQTVSSKIVLITLRASDLSEPEGLRSRFGPVGEITDVTDSFYWSSELWTDLMARVLSQNPKKIGVALFFSENLGPLRMPLHQIKLLKHPKIVWGTNVAMSERINQPLFSDDVRSNIGSIQLTRDEDGIIRRFIPSPDNFIERLTDKDLDWHTSRIINYRSSPGSFTEYSLRDVIEGRVPEDAFAGKYVLIGSEAASNTQYLTPLGSSSRHEVFAQILDNTVENRWIYRASPWVYIFFLLPLMILSVFMITNYPQTVAFVFMLWIATLTVALSAWVFDLFAIWIPAISTAMQLLATWVIFIGYQANIIERRNWFLQQEQKYLAELEQLKNNFVSLISHDLKTPIAKIQAIVDRLINDPGTANFNPDLKSLRVSSDELNRYIQSILKVLRVESRDFQLNKEVGDINETIQEAIEQLTPLAREKQIHIQSTLEPMFSIEVDFTLMREVLINLLENAIKYTPVGGKIEINSHEVGSKVWIEVQDTGEGIPANEVANVWGKFVRGKDQDLKTKGTGLGLYLVKYFIELHGGEVFLESELQKGTKVSFSLPLEETEVNT
jgi:two-component system, OmpR family, phosphate regulon sensor histidine kinase PhoR